MFAQANISLGMGIWTPIAVKLIDLGKSNTKSYSCFGLVFFSFLEHFHVVTETSIQVCLNTF